MTNNEALKPCPFCKCKDVTAETLAEWHAEGSIGFSLYEKNSGWKSDYRTFCSSDAVYYEVIGNVFDNPSLLNQVQQ
jgi:hypothetical protein